MKSKLKFDCERVDALDFLEALEIENITEATSEELRFSCPFPGHQHGDTRPSAYMNLTSTAWFCHSCKRKGNAISFLEEWDQISPQLAIRFLRERYGSSSPDPDSYSIVSELERYHEKRRKQELAEDPDPVLPEKVGADLLVDWDLLAAVPEEDRPESLQYMLDRGFTPETLNTWEIGYSDLDNRITIPLRNYDDELVGFKARAWDGAKPKYMLLGGQPKYEYERCRTSRHVFGLSRALEEHDGQIPWLILVEGELNVMSMWQMGYMNSAALLGSNFSEIQMKQIISACEGVTIFFDSDDSGWTGTRSVVDELSPYLPIKVCAWHDYDANDVLQPDEDGSPEEMAVLLDRAKSSLQIALEATIGI